MRTADRDSLLKAIEDWKGRRVVVFGDMILDEFVYGRTGRVSREAPVVIVRYDCTGHFPGGAANAAQNVASLGGRAMPVGGAARDDGGSKLREYFRDRGIALGGLLTLGGRPTTTKTRIMAGDFHAQRQQIVRIDREADGGLGERSSAMLLSALSSRLESADAVILSDYGQGVFSPEMIRRSIALCRKARVPVVADSRFRIGAFSGVTTATPNEVEAASAAGTAVNDDSGLDRAGRSLLRMLRSSSLLVTRGRFGMSLFEPRRKRRDIGVFGSPEATDVTGAGDTVAAAVALSLAAGHGMETAMTLANAAASVVVMKRGTAVATPEEVAVAIERAFG